MSPKDEGWELIMAKTTFFKEMKIRTHGSGNAGLNLFVQETLESLPGLCYNLFMLNGRRYISKKITYHFRCIAALSILILVLSACGLEGDHASKPALAVSESIVPADGAEETAAQESLEGEPQEQERLEQERQERERLEQERLEQERLEQLEQERLEQERRLLEERKSALRSELREALAQQPPFLEKPGNQEEESTQGEIFSGEISPEKINSGEKVDLNAFLDWLLTEYDLELLESIVSSAETMSSGEAATTDESVPIDESMPTDESMPSGEGMPSDAGRDFGESVLSGWSAAFYEATGCSLRVLADRSLGYLENQETAAAHFIYLRDAADGVVDLAFAGDICLTEDGYVIDHYDELGGDLEQCLSEEILETLRNADISMLNHEYPVSTRGKALAGKYYTFRAAPEREVILQEMGIDLVSLANNHVYDFGADAFSDTLETLRQIGIPYVGAGEDLDEASRPVYFVCDGLKIGFVAANRSEKKIYTPEAGEDSPGVVRMYDTARIKEILEDASERCDYLIAYVHWGTEDSKYYEDYQTEIAKELFDAGADIIIGSHPHVLQGLGYVEGKPVIYSLGDFWFNRETKYTSVLKLKITAEGLAELSLLPCRQEGYETHYLEEEAEQKEFFDYLRRLSPGVLIDEKGNVRAE